MADQAALNLDFSRMLPGRAESRWLRVEQVEPENEMATMAGAARLIDSLFDTEPCRTNSMGSGGQAVRTDAQGAPADMPDEETFTAVARRELDLAFCNTEDYWATEVDVLRSHQSPWYALRSDSAQIGRAVVVRKTVTETIDLQGAGAVDLKWPYLRGLQISGAGAQAEVRGSTVNFNEPVTGHLRLSYQTVFERVTILVPRRPDGMGSGQMEAEPASVVAFWAELAASCDLNQPPLDESLDALDIKRLCGKTKIRIEDVTPLECWETVEHFQRCNCSKSRTGIWHETVPAACPEGLAAGTHYLGMRGQFDGYVHCGGEEDEVSEPWFYEAFCCWPPEAPLPRCRKTWSLWRGGAEIEGGPQRWIDMYGQGTRLIPVSPPDNICGDLLVEWDVRKTPCCDGVPEMSINPDVAPEVMADNSEAYLQILGGMGPYTVSTESTGLYIGKIGDKRLQTMSTLIRLRSTNICGAVSVTIADACGQVATHIMRATNGQWITDPNPPSRCAGPPWSEVVYEGFYHSAVAGARKLLFQHMYPIVSSNCSSMVPNPLSSCEQYCAGIAGTGSYYDTCGIFPLVHTYDDAGCPPGTANMCQCNAVVVQAHYRWVC